MTSLGFRRRCSWCGLQLRQWQLNLCRVCKPHATGDAGIYLQSGGPPFRERSRWGHEPDAVVWPRWIAWMLKHVYSDRVG